MTPGFIWVPRETRFGQYDNHVIFRLQGCVISMFIQEEPFTIKLVAIVSNFPLGVNQYE